MILLESYNIISQKFFSDFILVKEHDEVDDGKPGDMGLIELLIADRVRSQKVELNIFQAEGFLIV